MASVDDNNVLVKKFTVKDGCNQKELFVKLIWKDNDADIFHITIIHSDRCYTGRFSRQFAAKFRKDTLETEEEYMGNLRKGLFGDDELFTYEIKMDILDDSVKFSWKKCYVKTDVVMVHGSVPLHENKEVSKDVLLQFLIEKNKEYKNEIKTLNEKLETVETKFQQSEAALKQIHNSQFTLEQTLYGKFVNLLNSKKRRIQVLQESLNHLIKDSNSSL